MQRARPPLETAAEQSALVGRRVLVAHDSKHATGWFMARVRFVGVSAQVRLKCESANFVVTYTKKDTNGELQGDEGRELSARNYGPGEWWLLLDEQ